MVKVQRLGRLALIVTTALGLFLLPLPILQIFPVQAQSQPENFLFTPVLATPPLEPSHGLTSTLRFGVGVSTAGAETIPLAAAGSQAFTSKQAAYVSPAAFHQAGESPADSFLFWPEGGYLYNVSSSPSTPTVLIAPVALPNGATITGFSMVLFDADPVNDVIAVLYRKNLRENLASAAEVVLALTTSLADPTQLHQVSNRLVSPGTALVSYDYSYYIAFQLNPGTGLNQRIFGFSVDYEGGAASGVEVIPSAAFRHDGDRADEFHFDFGTGFVRNRGNRPVCLVAPVSPPAGATLAQLRASIFDSSDNSDLQVQLHRLRLATGNTDLLATVASTGTAALPSTGEQLSALLSSVVSSHYSYYLSTCFEPGTASEVALFGARLFYTTTLTTSNAAPEVGSQEAQNLQRLVIPAAAFLGAGETGATPSEVNGWELSPAEGFLTGDRPERVCLAAPVYLPVRSVIKSFTAYVEDNSFSRELTLFLDRTGFQGEWRELGRVTSLTGGGIRALTDSTLLAEDQAEVIAPAHNYHLNFCLPAQRGHRFKFYGLKVVYRPPETVTELYLPILAQSSLISPTQLFLTNQTTAPLTYTISNTPIGDINCTIAAGATAQACGGPFIPGFYSFSTGAGCGQKIGQRTYRPGNETLLPFRCH